MRIPIKIIGGRYVSSVGFIDIKETKKFNLLTDSNLSPPELLYKDSFRFLEVVVRNLCKIYKKAQLVYKVLQRSIYHPPDFTS